MLWLLRSVFNRTSREGGKRNSLTSIGDPSAPRLRFGLGILRPSGVRSSSLFTVALFFAYSLPDCLNAQDAYLTKKLLPDRTTSLSQRNNSPSSPDLSRHHSASCTKSHQSNPRRKCNPLPTRLLRQLVHPTDRLS